MFLLRVIYRLVDISYVSFVLMSIKNPMARPFVSFVLLSINNL